MYNVTIFLCDLTNVRSKLPNLVGHYISSSFRAKRRRFACIFQVVVSLSICNFLNFIAAWNVQNEAESRKFGISNTLSSGERAPVQNSGELAPVPPGNRGDFFCRWANFLRARGFSLTNFVFQSLTCIFERRWSFRHCHLLLFENIASR